MISVRHFNITLLCAASILLISTMHAEKPSINSDAKIIQYITKGKAIRNRIITAQSLIIIGGIAYIDKIKPELKTQISNTFDAFGNSCTNVLNEIRNMFATKNVTPAQTNDSSTPPPPATLDNPTSGETIEPVKNNKSENENQQ